MKLINKLSAKILTATAGLLTIVFDGLIGLVETMVFYISGFFKGCLALVSMGGCLFFLLFFNLAMRLIFNPIALPVVLFLLTFLMLGGRLVSYLKYIKYITTEYLYHTANHLVDGKAHQYKAFNTFKAAYKRAEEERIREEQQRYYQRQREWEEQFWQSWNQQNYQGGGYGYGNYGGQGSQGFANPSTDFKYRYEKSCDILGVAYNADKQEIKTAYRKKAKEYHPDLSKLPDATKIFQEITAAYEFLSDENRQRYSSL